MIMISYFRLSKVQTFKISDFLFSEENYEIKCGNSAVKEEGDDDA